jgi:hypothetical protein
MTSLLVSIDETPWCYWGLCGLAWLLTLGLAALPLSDGVQARLRRSRWSGWATSDGAFLGAMALMLLCFRWPFFFFPHQLNPDESSRISQALTLKDDLIFWRSISAGTSGPLNVFPHLFLGLFDPPRYYGVDRFLALSVAFGSLVIFYATLRRQAGPGFARVGTMAPATFLALTTNGDFLHFSSEHIPMLLLAAAWYFTLRLAEPGKAPGAVAWLAGCALGAAPFAKLQASVIALTIAVAGGVFIFLRSESWGRRWKLCGFLTLGGLTVPAVILATTALGGVFENFWQSYILMNIGYASSSAPFGEFLASLPTLSFSMREFVAFFEGMTIAGLAGLGWITFVVGWRNLGRSGIAVLAASTAVMVTALFSSLAPCRPFPHYFLLSVLPLAGWACACCAARPVREDGARAPLEPTAGILVLWMAVGITVQLADFVLSRAMIEVRGHVRECINAPRSDVADTILRYGSKGEALAIWGWMHEYHVETGMKRATSDLILEYLWNSKLEGKQVASYLEFIPDFFEKLYIDDLRRSNPPVFVDAVAPGAFIFADSRTFGYETFPALREFVDENYSFAHEIRGTRIFVRKDRRAEVEAAARKGPPAGGARSK